MSNLNLGTPTVPGEDGLPPNVSCCSVPLSAELCNPAAAGGADVTFTTQQIIDLAVAGATQNAQTFPEGEAITGAAPQVVSAIRGSVVPLGVTITKDDGTKFPVTCDASSVAVAPNGGTNVCEMSAGGTFTLGGTAGSCAKPITKTDTVVLKPGAAVIVEVVVCLCKTLAGTVVDPTALNNK